MNALKSIFKTVLVLGISAGIAACGGGGGTSALTPGNAVTIQGTVPGSAFVAVDDGTNAEVARATASGTPKTFSMTIASGKSYRFYLVENETAGTGARVYPYFAGPTNVFGMSDNAAGQMIDLGTVAPDFATGNASSTASPTAHMGVTAMGASTAMPPTLAGAMFSVDNLAGNWRFHTIATSGTMSWTRGALSMDNAGLGAMTGLVRNGVPMPNVDNIPYAMSQAGMLHETGDNTFRGTMSQDRTLFMATFTDNAGGFNLMIARKNGGTFAPSDLDGTWQFHRMTAAADNVASGWAYGRMIVSGGIGTIASISTSSGSTAEAGRVMPFALDAGGVLAETGDASFGGAMSMDKDLIVATDNGTNGPQMWILVRTVGTFSMSDLAGDWMFGGVIAGNPGSRAWMNGLSVMGSSGAMTVPMMTGPAGAMSMAQSSLSMNSGGAVSMTGMSGGGMGGGMMGGTVTSTYHATMAPSKTMLVSTFSDGTGGQRLMLQMK